MSDILISDQSLSLYYPDTHLIPDMARALSLPPAPSALAGSLRQTDPASVSESQDDTGDTGDQSEAGMPGADQSADPGPGLGITFPCDRGLEPRLPLGDSAR